MKNICLLTIDLSTVGGINKVTFDLAKDLQEQGFNISICGILNGNITPFYSTNNIKIHNLFDNNLPFKKYFINGIKKLKQYLIQNNIDIVLLEGEAAALLGGLTRLFYRKPTYIFCDHGALTYDITGIAKISTNITLWFCGILNNWTIFETEKGSNCFKTKFHINKTSYIYNYGDFSIPKTIENIDNKPKILLTVGRMSNQKGYDILIEIAKNIKAKTPWQWHLIGDGELFNLIKEKIIEANLTDKIILLGNCKNIQKIYKDYYLMVCTSRHEGLPMALIEAKFANLPIISFDINTGPSEIIQNNKNGELIPPFQIQTMANRISYIIDNPSLREEYRNNSNLEIQNFTKSNVINQWKQLFDSLTN